MTWNLKAAVRIGDTIHVHQTVAATRPTSKGDRGIVTFDVEVLNQHGEVCQDGQWVVMFQRAAPRVTAADLRPGPHRAGRGAAGRAGPGRRHDRA